MSVIRSVTNPVGSAAAAIDVAAIWPCRRSFSTTNRTASSTVFARSGSARIVGSCTSAVIGRPCRSR